MSKYQKGNFIQVPKAVYKKFSMLSSGAIEMYLHLKFLEHKYTDKSDTFHITDEKLSQIMGVSTKTIERYRKELIQAEVILYARDFFLYRTEKGFAESNKKISNYIMNDDIADKFSEAFSGTTQGDSS